MNGSRLFGDAEARAVAEAFDLATLPPGFFADPYPTYDALQRFAPVKRLRDGSIFLTRWADLDQVYKQPLLYSSDKQQEFGPKFGTGSLLYQHHTSSLVFNDPPLHTRVRRLIAGALTPRAIAGMAPGLERLVDGLLDAMAAREAAGGRVDLIDDYASAIPIEIIGNLLDVPHAEREPLRAWSLAILGALEPLPSAEVQARGNAALAEFMAYLDGLIAARRARPGDPAHDVLTRLINGEPDDDGRRQCLLHHELVHNCVFLLNAGHETTTNLIGNALVTLLQHPPQRARLQADPALVRSTVEEMLRFESSNQLGNRITTQAVELGGVALPAGTRVTLCIGAANRDPARFADPQALDLARSPNKHLAFAAGIHMCLGANLARLEGSVAIGGFLRRFPQAQLAGEPVRGGRVRFRGWLHAPLRLQPAQHPSTPPS